MKNFALIDGRCPIEIQNSLSSLGYKVIPLPPFPSLPEPVCAHPDMLVFPLGQSLYIHRDYLRLAHAALAPLFDAGYVAVELDDQILPRYPHDVALNCALVGNMVFAYGKYMSGKLLRDLEAQGVQIINVKQGYAKCSTLTLGDRGVISADPSIERAALEAGIPVLRVSEGHVTLKGYSHGFIGGATGVDGNTVFFAGDLASHPDAEKIEDFCASLGFVTHSLAHLPLTDVGTIFFL